MRLNLSNFNELQLRVMAAVVGIPLIVGSVLYHPWGYFTIFFIICGACLLEFYQLLGLRGEQPLKTFGTFNGLLIYTITYLVASGQIKDDFYLLTFIGLSSVYLINLYIKKDKHPFTNIGFTFLGIIYVGIPFSLLHLLVFYANTYHFQIILGLLSILWASDTGAYFAGKSFGKRKLFERVSPKKTWEGSIGGAILATSVSLGLAYYFEYIPVWKWILIAIIIVVAGTYGDLVESLFKRTVKIKDSGNTIPGHGGFLDRFDGLLIAAPFIVVFIKLV